jgi:hypothetical protein
MATKMTDTTNPSYLIVDADVFGASTALELKRANPSASVTPINRTEFPNTSAASHDLNKIIRADYADILYTKFALRGEGALAQVELTHLRALISPNGHVVRREQWHGTIVYRVSPTPLSSCP